MNWPSRGKPEIHKRGPWWVVRWYDPISKQARALRTKSEGYARAIHTLMEANP